MDHKEGPWHRFAHCLSSLIYVYTHIYICTRALKYNSNNTLACVLACFRILISALGQGIKPMVRDCVLPFSHLSFYCKTINLDRNFTYWGEMVIFCERALRRSCLFGSFLESNHNGAFWGTINYTHIIATVVLYFSATRMTTPSPNGKRAGLVPGRGTGVVEGRFFRR